MAIKLGLQVKPVREGKLVMAGLRELCATEEELKWYDQTAIQNLRIQCGSQHRYSAQWTPADIFSSRTRDYRDAYN
jgi:hypothetical protein